MKIIAPASNQPGSGFKLPDQGTHTATLTSFEDLGHRDDPFNPGETKHEIRLSFELEDGSEQRGWYRVSLHPKAKLYEVVTALLGRNPPDTLEMDDLLGLVCELEIEHYVNPQGMTRSKIVDVRRARAVQ